MFVTLFTCLAGAAVGTATLLEASIHRSRRRVATRGTVETARSQHVAATSGPLEPMPRAAGDNAELYSLAAYRAVHRNTRVESAPVAGEDAEQELADVVQLDFRRATDSRTARLRARA